MDELKRQMIEAVDALDEHDKETALLSRGVTGSAWLDGRNELRSRLVLAVAGLTRSMVALWKSEDEQTPCGAELAGHVCGTKVAHVMHEDKRTGMRWPVVVP